MENDYIISGLIKKRAELAGLLEHHKTMVQQVIIDLDHLDATLRLFAPDIDLEEIRPKRAPPPYAGYQGEVSRTLLAALREADSPMTTQQLAQHVMAERGLDTADAKLVKTMTQRAGSALRHQRQKGRVRSFVGPEARLMWEIAR